MPETLEPLPDSLRALVDAEKACPDPQPDVADKVFSRVTVTLGIAATALTASAAQAATATLPARLSLLRYAPYRTLATFVVGATVGAAGYGTVAHFRAPTHAASPIVVAAPPPLPAPAPAAEPPAPPTPAPAPVAPAPSISVSSSASSASRARDEQLAAERNLIEMARTALARGRAESALVTLRRHARQFPHGQLSEERDSLLIQALVSTGDIGQARERATVFRRHYPGSLFAPAIEQALQSARSIP